MPNDQDAIVDDLTAALDLQLVPPGTVIDERFTIKRFLGRGGMCTVYEAVQLKLQRRCALKLLHLASINSSDAIMRFQREAVLSGELKHQNIVEVYGMGLYKTQPFIAMEFLEGKTLAAIVEESGPLSEDRAMPIFIQICDALSEAHSHNIVHRDLKPSNVIVLSPNDQVKLVDFGIARLLPESGEEVQKLTQTGQVLGTFLYMSPEQCMGKKVDQRTDLYSFGCLMHKILTGKTPFESDVPFELLGMHVGVAPPAMAGVSSRLNTIAAWCLRKDPEMRPQSAAQLKSVLLGGDLSQTGALDAVETQRFKAVKSKPKSKAYGVGITVAVLSLLFGAIVFWPIAIKALIPAQHVVVPPEEQALLDGVRAAEKSGSHHEIAITNTKLTKYYFDRKDFKNAYRFGVIAIKQYEEAGESDSVEALWDTYYTAIAGLSSGRRGSELSGYLARLADDDLPNATPKLKVMGALAAGTGWAQWHAGHKADHYFRRAIKHAEASGDFSLLQQTRMEYVQFLRMPYNPGSHSEDYNSLRGDPNEILQQIIDAGSRTQEDAVRVETAKQLLNNKVR